VSGKKRPYVGIEGIKTVVPEELEPAEKMRKSITSSQLKHVGLTQAPEWKRKVHSNFQEILPLLSKIQTRERGGRIGKKRKNRGYSRQLCKERSQGICTLVNTHVYVSGSEKSPKTIMAVMVK